MATFATISPYLQSTVLKKLDFPSYARFQQSSLCALEISSQLKTRLPLKADLVFIDDRFATRISIHLNQEEDSKVTSFDQLKELPVWIIAESMQTMIRTNAQFSQLANELKKCKITVHEMLCSEVEEPLYDMSILDNLAQAAKPQRMLISARGNTEFSNYEELIAIQKIPHLHLFGRITFDFLCHLKVEKLSIGCETALTKEEWRLYIQNSTVQEIEIFSEFFNDTAVLSSLPHYRLFSAKDDLSSPVSDVFPIYYQTCAYIVSIPTSNVLITRTEYNFNLNQLGSGSSDEIKAKGWKELRRILESPLDKR